MNDALLARMRTWTTLTTAYINGRVAEAEAYVDKNAFVGHLPGAAELTWQQFVETAKKLREVFKQGTQSVTVQVSAMNGDTLLVHYITKTTSYQSAVGWMGAPPSLAVTSFHSADVAGFNSEGKIVSIRVISDRMPQLIATIEGTMQLPWDAKNL